MLYVLTRRWIPCEDRFHTYEVEFMVGPLPFPDEDLVRCEAVCNDNRVVLTGTLLNEATGEDTWDRMLVYSCSVIEDAEADLYLATECWPVIPWVKEVATFRGDFPYQHADYGS